MIFMEQIDRSKETSNHSLEDSANLPDPDIIAQEIVEDLEAALSQFATIAADLKR
jgi:type I restriction enzyme M protein